MVYKQDDLIMCTNCKLHLEDVAEIEHIDNQSLEILKNPRRAMTVNYSVRMDDGSVRLISGFRVQYNNALGPAKGGIRIHQEVNFDEVSELAFLMSLKTALVGLPYGGGKGGIKLDPKGLSQGELERVVRGFIREIGTFIGPEVDIPAPDVNTNGQVMAWMLDEYEKIVQKKAPGVITGKPLAIGGSKGRDTATARGGFFILADKYKEQDVSQMKVAIQGFGNAGSHIATMLHGLGMKIVAVSDSSGGVVDMDGLNVEELIAYKADRGRFNAYDKGEQVSNEALLELDVDVLIPAALGGVITQENAARIKAPVVLELANGPVTSDADTILEQNNIEVIPGILANAGGVIVSYFEWVQNLQNYYWTAEEVDSRLKEIILNAYHDVLAEQKATGYSLRRSSTALAVNRILEAERLRGHL